MAKGGKRTGAGRKKGAPNKITGALKDMILQALENKGGVKYLEQQAENEPVAFMGMLGKVLPLTLSGEGPGKFSITWES